MRYFFDRAAIYVKSGKGGDGMVHFRREKYRPKGGPDGGDGGNGGSVILAVNSQLNTLRDFRYQRHYKAEDGESGKPNCQTGKSGKDIILYLPPGTVVYDEKTNRLLKELLTEEERFIVVKGGNGGRGNVHFKSSTNQTPIKFERGEEGKERWIRLELKLIADVSFVGFPNAGKSTLLRRISDAEPKIASYPFTTLEPYLGSVNTKWGNVIFQDVPGIIEDAHRGKGLGIKFLKHIERSYALLFLLDITDNPIEKYHILLKEIKAWKRSLIDKPCFVALNKIDIWKGNVENFRDIDKNVFFISALAGEGVSDMIDKITEVIGRLKKGGKNAREG